MFKVYYLDNVITCKNKAEAEAVVLDMLEANIEINDILVTDGFGNNYEIIKKVELV